MAVSGLAFLLVLSNRNDLSGKGRKVQFFGHLGFQLCGLVFIEGCGDAVLFEQLKSRADVVVGLLSGVNA